MDLGGMILADTRRLEAEAVRAADELPKRSTCEQSIDSWDNPDWECEGWMLDTRVGLAGIAGLDVQLDVLRGTIDGMKRDTATAGRPCRQADEV